MISVVASHPSIASEEERKPLERGNGLMLLVTISTFVREPTSTKWPPLEGTRTSFSWLPKLNREGLGEDGGT